MADRIPLVDYLVLPEADGAAHLQANRCTACDARFFDRRNACASCFGTDFTPTAVSSDGVLTSFTIVERAAAGIEVPFAAGVIDCDGTTVRANIINTPANPEHVKLGMAVRLATYSLGVDDNGTEAIGFGFEPA